MNDCYNVNEMSKLIEVTSQTVYKWIRIGMLKAEKNCSGHYVIKREDILDFIANNPYYERCLRVFLTKTEYKEREKNRLAKLRKHIVHISN